MKQKQRRKERKERDKTRNQKKAKKKDKKEEKRTRTRERERERERDRQRNWKRGRPKKAKEKQRETLENKQKCPFVEQKQGFCIKKQRKERQNKTTKKNKKIINKEGLGPSDYTLQKTLKTKKRKNKENNQKKRKQTKKKQQKSFSVINQFFFFFVFWVAFQKFPFFHTLAQQAWTPKNIKIGVSSPFLKSSCASRNDQKFIDFNYHFLPFFFSFNKKQNPKINLNHRKLKHPLFAPLFWKRLFFIDNWAPKKSLERLKLAKPLFL